MLFQHYAKCTDCYPSYIILGALTSLTSIGPNQSSKNLRIEKTGVIYICERGCWKEWILRIFYGEAQWKQEKSNCNQGRSGMFLDVLEIITYAWFLHVFRFWIFNVLLIGVDAKGHKFFSRYWLLMCSPQTCLWSSPLAWAHWKIMRCGFIWFLLLLCLFVFSPSSMVFHYTCFGSFLLVSWWPSVSISYESKFWEDKDRKDPLFHPTEISSEMSL